MIKEHENPDGTVGLEFCCDFCSHSTTHNKSNTGITPIMECDACGRLVCSGHRRFYGDPWVHSHRGMYCLECWEIGRKYREEMLKVENQHWDKQNRLRLTWHRAARGNRQRRLEEARKVQASLLSG